MSIAREIIKFQGEKVTTNNTAETLVIISAGDYPEETAFSIEIDVCAKDADKKKSMSVVRRTSALKHSSAVSLTGAVISSSPDVGNFSPFPSVTIDTFGTDIRVRIAGLNGSTIEWFGEIRAIVD